MAVWGHTGCDAAYSVALSVCPRCRQVNVMEEIELPKITRFGGHSNAGLTEKSAGFVDTTAATTEKAKAKAEVPSEPDADDHGNPVPDVTAPPFDPAELSVAGVLALKADCDDDQWAAVLESERTGKARFGILGK